MTRSLIPCLIALLTLSPVSASQVGLVAFHPCCQSDAQVVIPRVDALPAPPPQPPRFELLSWSVVGVHGSSQAVALPLTAGYVESRGVDRMRIKIQFTVALDAATLAGEVLHIDGATNGDVTPLVAGLSLEDAGRTLVLDLMAPLPDGDRYTLTLNSAVRSLNGQALSTQAVAEMGVLLGDVDGSGTVTAADLALVRAAAGQGITAENARLDADGSGDISGRDLAAIRPRLGQSLP